jgi:hypothetical protein
MKLAKSMETQIPIVTSAKGTTATMLMGMTTTMNEMKFKEGRNFIYE